MSDIILGIIVVVTSLVTIAVQSKLMSRQTFAGFLLALLLIISGGNLVISIDNSHSFRRELSSVCAGQREVARTGAEALAEQNEESARFLSKSTFPGFTHNELEALINQKKGKATERVKRLESVANRTCTGE